MTSQAKKKIIFISLVFHHFLPVTYNIFPFVGIQYIVWISFYAFLIFFNFNKIPLVRLAVNDLLYCPDSFFNQSFELPVMVSIDATA